ncbi:hypothetical protein GCM10018785_42300 [Streptomyces longispororuber]|uniref:Uncharacterized protein n=1 Tax=Streptomyces longispororuber TaxID=68230 RepID=A0A918ZTA2_9ACTN|nr:hypothetical protein GCM10018785_42300 [Streptomyces longispororuber]
MRASRSVVGIRRLPVGWLPPVCRRRQGPGLRGGGERGRRPHREARSCPLTGGACTRLPSCKCPSKTVAAPVCTRLWQPYGTFGNLLAQRKAEQGSAPDFWTVSVGLPGPYPAVHHRHATACATSTPDATVTEGYPGPGEGGR